MAKKLITFKVKQLAVSADISLLFVLSYLFSTLIVNETFQFGFVERIALGLIVGVFLVCSLILHEFGHLWTAHQFGIQSTRIHIGCCSFVLFDRPFHTPMEEFVIASGGLLATFICSIVSFSIAIIPMPQFLETLFVVVGMLNAVLFVFNILPILPLDGGRMTRAILWAVHGSPSTGSCISAILSIFFCFALISAFPFNWLLTVAAILLNIQCIVEFAVAKEYRSAEKCLINELTKADKSVRELFIMGAITMHKKQPGSHNYGSIIHVTNRLKEFDTHPNTLDKERDLCHNDVSGR